MAFEKMTEHITEVKNERDTYIRAVLPILSRFQRDILFLYLTLAVLSTLFVLFTNFQRISLPSSNLLTLSTFLFLATSIISSAQGINIFEKLLRRFYTTHVSKLEKLDREIYVLERFKYGHIDMNEIRSYYADQAKTLEKEKLPKKPSLIPAWIIFMLISIALILFVLSV